MSEVQVIGQMDNTLDHTYESANRVYDINGIAPTLNTCGGGGLHTKILDEPRVVASRGRGNGWEQLLEVSNQPYTNALTTVQKDNMVLQKGEYEMAEKKQVYRIRKLTPRECFRLMGVRDDDYDKLTVSDTQKYKQAGNSIVVDVLEDIFDNMFVKECKSGRLF